MNRKGLLSTILISCMTINLVSCGGKGDNKEDELSPTDNTSKIIVQVERPWIPYYNQVKDRVLKEYPKATIDFIEVGSFDHLDALDKTDATNPDIADVFALPADRLYGLANNNMLAPIDSKTMAEKVGGFKRFDEGLGGNFKINNEYLAFPYNIETLIVYLNKENAETAGIDINKNIEFTDLDFGEMLVAAHDAWFGVGFANSANFEFLEKSNDDKLSTDGTRAWADLTEDQKNLFTALYNYWKPHYENKTNLWDKDAAGGYLDAQFSAKDGAAIRIDGPWATTAMQDKVGADNLEVIPLSQIVVNGRALSHWKSGWGLGINVRCEEDINKMNLAQSFIMEIVNPTYAKDLFNATGKILENVDPSAFDGIGGINEKVIKATYASYEGAVSRPLFIEYGKVWDTWQNALLSWSSQKPASAEEAYKQVQASFQSMMSSY